MLFEMTADCAAFATNAELMMLKADDKLMATTSEAGERVTPSDC